MKDIVQSVKITNCQWVDEDYEVKVHLFDSVGKELQQKIDDAIAVEDISADTSYKTMWSTPATILIGSKVWWIVDFDAGWYTLEMAEHPCKRMSLIIEEDGAYNLRLYFSKEKEGIDKYDYTDYGSGSIPENAWIEPAHLLRDIFSSK